MRLCNIKDRHKLNTILEETKNEINKNINEDFSKKNTLYEDSLLVDYFIDMRDELPPLILSGGFVAKTRR